MSKPEVTIPDGPPPTELVIEDLEVGDGTEATVSPSPSAWEPAWSSPAGTRASPA
jgi:hypothetical protein